MKNKFLCSLVAILSLVCLSACTTIQGPDGQMRQVMSPEGMALLEVVSAVGVGAGTGALMNRAPGWANGAVSGAAGNVTGQVLRAVVPSQQSVWRNQPQQVPYPVYSNPQPAPYPVYNKPQQTVYTGVTNPVPVNQPLFTRTADGRYVQVQ